MINVENTPGGHLTSSRLAQKSTRKTFTAIIFEFKCVFVFAKLRVRVFIQISRGGSFFF